MESICSAILPSSLILFLKSVLPNCHLHIAIWLNLIICQVDFISLSNCEVHVVIFSWPHSHIANSALSTIWLLSLWTTWMYFKLPTKLTTIWCSCLSNQVVCATFQKWIAVVIQGWYCQGHGYVQQDQTTWCQGAKVNSLSLSIHFNGISKIWSWSYQNF